MLQGSKGHEVKRSRTFPPGWVLSGTARQSWGETVDTMSTLGVRGSATLSNNTTTSPGGGVVCGGGREAKSTWWFQHLNRVCASGGLCDCVVTLEATMSDLFPTGQTTMSQSESRSEGTSTNHSDSISCKHKEVHFTECAVAATVILDTTALPNVFDPTPLWIEDDWRLKPEPSVKYKGVQGGLTPRCTRPTKSLYTHEWV